MPVTRSSVCSSPYPVVVPEFNKINKQLKKAKNAEDKENILANLKKSPELYDAYLKQFPLSPSKPSKKPSTSEVPMEYEENDVPKFSATYRARLTKIYEVLKTTKSEEKKQSALDELKSDPEILKEFLTKTVPPAEFLPVVPETTQLYGLFLPLTWFLYKDALAELYTALREAKTPEARDAVLNKVVAKTHLVREFLKKNVPQFSEL